MKNSLVFALLIAIIVFIAGCPQQKPEDYTADKKCSDFQKYDNQSCDAKCKSYEICVKSITLPTADGLKDRQCYSCFAPDITDDYLRITFASDLNIAKTDNGSIELRWNITGNKSKIETAVAVDSFNGTTKKYDLGFDEEKNQFILKSTIEDGQHIIKIEAHLVDGTIISSKDVNVESRLSNQLSNVYCCTNNYNLYWENIPRSSNAECPDLGDPESKISYSTPIEAEHECIFGYICLPDGTMKKVRGEEHRAAVNGGKTIYPSPEGINCPKIQNTTSQTLALSANFELLDTNKGYAQVDKLPYGSNVHFVVASNTKDMTKELPIIIVMKVNGEEVFKKTIPNEPEYNCRGPDGCSTDGPFIMNEWRGKSIDITAVNKNGELLAEYKE